MSSERWGRWYKVRLAYLGDAIRDEWINLAVVVGSDDGTEWGRIKREDIDHVLHRAGFERGETWLLEHVLEGEPYMTPESWEEVQRILESTGHAMSAVQITDPLKCRILTTAQDTAQRIFTRIVSE